MGSVNPTQRLCEVNSDIETLQGLISQVQKDMDEGITGDSSKDMLALRVELNKLKASLGESRNEEAFWRQEIQDTNQSRKSLGDIARA